MGISVVLAEYDPRWPQLFDEEKARILSVVGNRAVAIEHIGSTSVPGLAAKPILDIMLGVRHLTEDFAACIGPLCRIGYEFVPRDDFYESRFCTLGRWGATDRHLHITEHGSAFWHEKILFRDYLRKHPQIAAQYVSLKRNLAQRHHDDRPAYTAAKGEFILGVVRRARLGYGTNAPVAGS